MKRKKHGIMPTATVHSIRGNLSTKRFAFTLAALLTASLLITGCGARTAEPARYEKTFFDAFDTVTTVIVYDTSEKNAEAVLTRAHELLSEYHKLYDIYYAYDGMNNLYTVNQSAGGAPVTVDARIIDLLKFAKEMDVLTNGGTNVAMGCVTELWRVCREAGVEDPAHAALPAEEELTRAARHTNIEDVLIDESANTVQLANPEMQAGWASTVALILFMGGLTIALIGIVGEYIGRIYLSINRYPQFVVRSVTRGQSETFVIAPEQEEEKHEDPTCHLGA